MKADVCPYCRAEIAEQDGPIACEGCGTLHHADCYTENGGCTIFGCAKAPGDEPKLSVSAPELVAVTAPSTPQPPAIENRPAPPPPPGGVATQVVSSPPATVQELRAVANRVVPSMFGGFNDDGPEVEPVEPPQDVPSEPKKRTNFIVLGALLGAFGAHNFYAGYYKKAGIQLAITLLTIGFASPMSWMWAVIDICTVNKDSRGVQFQS